VCTASGFFQWPNDQGWEQKWTQTNNQYTFASRIQSWLYFGLLAAFLDEDFSREELTKIGQSGRRIVDSSSFKNRIRRWRTKYLDRQRLAEAGVNVVDRVDLLLAQRARAEKCVRFTILLFNQVVIPALDRFSETRDIDAWTSPVHAVVLSIDILIDLLIGAIHYLSNPKAGRMTLQSWDPEPIPRKTLTAENRVIARSMLRAGRCPSLCWRHRFSSSKLYYGLFLPAVNTTVNHSSCTHVECKLYNVATVTYETLHTETCQNCEYVIVDVNKVKDCIAAGSIPLISLQEASTGPMTARVVEGNADSKYTAISHVWSGGLGNFQSNSLPLCQLERLKSLLRNLPYETPAPELYKRLMFIPVPNRSVRKLARFPLGFSSGNTPDLFWIDTLCIPIGATEEIFKAAIDSMAEIYAAATTVLVLDPELQKVSLNSLVSHQSFLEWYIDCSPWMSRSWTLHEGALASNTVFVFNDGLLSAREFYNQTRRKFPETPILTMHGLRVPWQRILDLETASYNAYSDAKYKADRFNSVWNELVTRSTSKKEDVPGIFATLLGLSAKEILNKELPVVSKMKAIIKAQELIPLSIFYEKPSTSEGCLEVGWNPPFPGVDTQLSPLDYQCGLLRVTDDGFVIKDPGYGLSGFIATPSTGQLLHLRDTMEGQEVWVHMSTCDRSDAGISPQKIMFMFTPVPALGRNGMPEQDLQFRMRAQEPSRCHMYLPSRCSIPNQTSQGSMSVLKLNIGSGPLFSQNYSSKSVSFRQQSFFVWSVELIRHRH
jgi:hypothetical protein